LGKRLEDFDQDKRIRGTVFLDLNENERRERARRELQTSRFPMDWILP
jgi:hypothetical protein